MSTLAADCAALLTVHNAFPAGSPELAALERLVTMAQRYEYVLPLMTGDDSPVANRRTVVIVAGMLSGLVSDELIAWAMAQQQ